jgi:sugar lactone lactonase YvrE
VGVSALMAFDLKSGSQKGAWPFPAPASACNDITIARDGTAYATDTPNGRIFVLKPGAKALELYASDARLKGIDGIVFGADGTLYLNIVSRGQLMRVDRGPDGAMAGLTELKLSQPVAGPDGFRLIAGNRFLLAEGTSGRIDEVTITGDEAAVRVLKEGLQSPPGVTPVGAVAYGLEGKILYLIDPKLKGQDPGPFTVRAIPLAAGH